MEKLGEDWSTDQITLPEILEATYQILVGALVRFDFNNKIKQNIFIILCESIYIILTILFIIIIIILLT